MATVFRALFLLVTLLTASGEDESDACGDEVESKTVAYVDKHYGGKMQDLLKAFDTEGDGAVSEADLKAVFEKAGVSSECLHFAKESLKHLHTHHDHNDDNTLHHDEM